MNPLLLLLAGGRGLLSRGGLIKKVLMFSIAGPVGLLLGGRFSLTDYLLIPMIAPMFGSLFSGLGLGGGAAAPAAGTAM